MPGKRPAPKAAKGKKAPSRPAVRKAVGHKPEPVRVRAAPGHARKSAAAPKKPVAAPPAAGSAPPVELRKPLRVTPATPPPATATMITASRSAAHAVNAEDRKSTRLNSSHSQISYAVFCLKKKKKNHVLEQLSYSSQFQLE